MITKEELARMKSGIINAMMKLGENPVLVDMGRLHVEVVRLQAELVATEKMYSDHADALVENGLHEINALTKERDDAIAHASELGKATAAALKREQQVNDENLRLRDRQLPAGTAPACSVCNQQSEDWPSAAHNGGRCNSYEHVELERPCPMLPKSNV